MDQDDTLSTGPSISGLALKQLGAGLGPSLASSAAAQSLFEQQTSLTAGIFERNRELADSLASQSISALADSLASSAAARSLFEQQTSLTAGIFERNRELADSLASQSISGLALKQLGAGLGTSKWLTAQLGPSLADSAAARSLFEHHRVALGILDAMPSYADRLAHASLEVLDEAGSATGVVDFDQAVERAAARTTTPFLESDTARELIGVLALLIVMATYMAAAVVTPPLGLLVMAYLSAQGLSAQSLRDLAIERIESRSDESDLDDSREIGP